MCNKFIKNLLDFIAIIMSIPFLEVLLNKKPFEQGQGLIEYILIIILVITIIIVLVALLGPAIQLFFNNLLESIK